MKNNKVKKLLNDAIKEDQKSISEGDLEKTKLIFKKNTQLLKSIIKKNGWPSIVEGSRSFHNAWLIAQHSDHDPFFQLQCLGLVLPDIKKDKEIMVDCSFLIDRILTNLGHEQIFGTQLMGKLKKPSTFSPKQLDLLRNEIGLESIESYIKMMKKQSR